MKNKDLLCFFLCLGILFIPLAGYCDCGCKGNSTDKKKIYYNDLRKRCKIRSNQACCLSSVDYLEKNNLHTPQNGTCEKGYVAYTVVKCVSSYQACVPQED